YLTAPNSADNLRGLGWADDDRADGGSDALVDALVAWGDEAAIRGRIEEHLAAGADHVCIQPLAGRGQIDLAPLRALAPALREL
ncbi:MAG TPA: hypothetical protein VH572_10440, partial [Gaiella sp.]